MWNQNDIDRRGYGIIGPTELPADELKAAILRELGGEIIWTKEWRLFSLGKGWRTSRRYPGSVSAGLNVSSFRR